MPAGCGWQGCLPQDLTGHGFLKPPLLPEAVHSVIPQSSPLLTHSSKAGMSMTSSTQEKDTVIGKCFIFFTQKGSVEQSM